MQINDYHDRSNHDWINPDSFWISIQIYYDFFFMLLIAISCTTERNHPPVWFLSCRDALSLLYNRKKTDGLRRDSKLDIRNFRVVRSRRFYRIFCVLLRNFSKVIKNNFSYTILINLTTSTTANFSLRYDRFQGIIFDGNRDDITTET